MSRRRWQRTDGLQQRTLGQECVVFHPGAGTTHLLTPAAAALMGGLGEGTAMDEAALARHLGLSTEDAEAELERWLSSLQSADLIRERP
ncbi:MULTISPECIES: HPr-rel-A system PqqD family peptide chaperone [unclassified Thioalkalivibrio]|uniref:HPr-rel-A system PqqD family peptide chaperone n=1 Tax=unclassified Thioalkalivibrio TaxID=2621013 RepID=UPI000475F6E3|nr:MULTISPECIES: HPr-rel-A system PqqD family peptide chaperone [unclassified Thioalkalivibrio]